VLRDRATYFHTVNDRATVQAITEDAHHAERGSRGSRQATRYLVHGLHEYKGKFNPQMARALVNAIDPDATALMDPYCGSGTTLIEGMRLGMSVAGIDHNPLAVWVSQVKVATHRLSGQDGLVTEFDKITARILLAMKEAQDSEVATAPAHVDESDASYLHRWFPEPVLAALWAGLTTCREADHPVADVVALCISNIVRQVSWQLPEDLRVRRRPSDWTPPSVAEVFASVAERGRLALLETERATPVPADATATVHAGSSREQDLVSTACLARQFVRSPRWSPVPPRSDRTQQWPHQRRVPSPGSPGVAVPVLHADRRDA
jgi:site-specific DNA-methyltransferase (cytosine-N4-specific)